KDESTNGHLDATSDPSRAWLASCWPTLPGPCGPGEVRVSTARLLAVGLIFMSTTVAWSTLGASLVSRTGESDERLSREVAQLWGGRHNQVAPQATLWRPRQTVEMVTEPAGAGHPVVRQVTKTVMDAVPLPLRTSTVTVDLSLEHRQKGL